VDSGATDTFVREECERFIKNAKTSTAMIHIADDTTLNATITGDLEMFAINTPNYKGLGLGCAFSTKATVVPDIAHELLSLSELFSEQGFRVTLDPKGISELYLYDADNDQETRIPVRYDYEQRGFYVDAVMADTAEHRELLAARVADLTFKSSAKRHTALSASTFEQKHLGAVTKMLQEHDSVEYVRSCCSAKEKPGGCMPATKDPLIIRRELTNNNRGMNRKEAHEHFIHKGFQEDCWICKIVGGVGRREKHTDPDVRVQSNLPGHTFALDICQWSHRAESGEGYTAQLVDICTGTPFGLHLNFKSDVVTQIEDWILAKRSDPHYNWMSYDFCSELYLDRDGVWDERATKWNDRIKLEKPKGGLGVKHNYSDPDRKNTNARPENAIKELERATKSLLFSKNLPPSAWKSCADQANWLNARLVYNGRSPDGDDILPLEALTNGQISRRQIRQQLSFFVPVGTPCLVWNSDIKGSALQSKVRWGIAQRMTGKAVEFLCPYNGHTFISRSYLAIKLKDGLNFYQFLGIKCPEMSNTAMIPVVPDSPIIITLPELAQCTAMQQPPSTDVSTVNINDPQPLVHIMDKAGRLFQANPEGKFEHTGQNMYEYDGENSDETSGFLKHLTDNKITKDGWNDMPFQKRDYNYQVQQMANRPRSIIGQHFEKLFRDKLYAGRVINYNQKTKLWKVQYGDGDNEEFDAKDITHYIIERLVSDINLPSQNRNISPAPIVTEDSVENNDALGFKVGQRVSVSPTCFDGNVPGRYSNTHPERCKGIITAELANGNIKVLFDEDGKSYDCAKVDCMRLSETVRSRPITSNTVRFECDLHENIAQPQPTYASDEQTSFDCVFQCKNYQLVPKTNHLGEQPISQDFWNDVTRRVTWNNKTNTVIEDLGIDDLRTVGATGKLPPNVKEIKCTFFFRKGCKVIQQQQAYVSKKGDKIKDVLKHFGIRPEYLRSYFKFINIPVHSVLNDEHQNQTAKAFKAHCKPGIVFQQPQGEKWVQIIRGFHDRHNAQNPSWKTRKLREEAYRNEQQLVRTCAKWNLTSDMGHEFAARRAQAYCAVQLAAKRHVIFQGLNKPETVIKMAAAIAASQTTTIKDPTTIFEALASKEAQDWIRALLDEEESLDSLGVFLHDQTMEQLKKLGITKKYIIPSRYVVNVKRHPDRTIDKLKIRRVIQGHKWAMQRGVHYDESFTPSPTQDTTRLLQALSIGHGWLPYAFDIKSAYQQAPSTGPKLAIKYPKGFERYHDVTGEEMYAVLKTNLNGKADAGRQFGKFRDAWILETFNSNGYTCIQSVRDPCLFTITCPEGHTTYMIAYCDDVDCHTTNMASMIKISNKFQERFGIKVVNPEFMLGVKRKRYSRDGILYVHLSQEEYIEELYESFKPHMSDKRRSQELPFPKGQRLYIGCEDVIRQS
jgi:hypothetical protein